MSRPTARIPDEDTLDAIRQVLDAHPVSFALLYGSAATEGMREGSDIDIDLADVRTMPSRFAYVVFDRGELLVGSETDRERLRGEAAGDEPTVSGARERVAAAVDRLHQES